MQQKVEAHSFNGLQRDLDISKHPVNYLYDAFNIRITAREGDTLLSITNERGPKQLFTGENKVKGRYLGSCMLNQYLIIFSTNREQDLILDDFVQHDYITRIDFSKSEPELKVLFDGNLNFHPKYLIEAIVSYENEDIQKTYWTDGYNQPRFINFAPNNDDRLDTYNSGSFNFVQDLQLKEEIEVERIESSSGLFTPGTIQYAFSYFNKNGAESNIFYTTPLYYTSFSTRGAKKDENVTNVFKIKLSGIDNSFDYIRIYSIHRSSINSVTTVKHVENIKITEDEQYEYYDTGTNGESLDPTELLYIGGEEILADTLEQKDGTLFFGNIKIKRKSIHEIKQYIQELEDNGEDTFDIITQNKVLQLNKNKISNNYYRYNSTLQYENSAGFKRGETYRIGVQFQYKNGKWSEPYRVDDKVQDLSPLINEEELHIPIYEISISQKIIDKIIELGYKKVRSVVVFPKDNERTIIAQGLVCPTVFNPEDREKNAPYAQPSWFLRPFTVNEIFNKTSKKDMLPKDINSGCYAEFRDSLYIPYTDKELEDGSEPLQVANAEMPVKRYVVDQNILNLYSPDLLYDKIYYEFEKNTIKFNLIGIVQFDSNVGMFDIQTSSTSMSKNGGAVDRVFGFSLTDDDADDKLYGGRSLISGGFYKDNIIGYDGDQFIASIQGGIANAHVEVKPYLVYTWQSNGSLNNDIERPSGKGTQTAVLKKKRIGNYKFSSNTNFFKTPYSFSKSNISNIHLFNEDNTALKRLNLFNNLNVNYYGNIDTLIKTKKIKKQYFVDSNINSSNNIVYNISPEGMLVNGYDDLIRKEETIRIKYKTTPHYVFSLNNSSLSRTILPSFYNVNRYDNYKDNSQIFTNSDKNHVRAEQAFWLVSVNHKNDNGQNTVSEVSDDKAKKVVSGFSWSSGNNENNWYPDTGYTGSNYAMARQRWENGICNSYGDDTTGSIGNINPYLVSNSEYLFHGKKLYKISKSGEPGNASGYVKWYEVGSGYNNTLEEGLVIKLIRQSSNSSNNHNSEYAKYIIYKSGVWQDYAISDQEDDNIDANNFVVGTQQDFLTVDSVGVYPTKPFLFLGELVRDVENVFGGSSDNAIKNNLWIPAGKATQLYKGKILAEYGDTWYQRFDCLKTYPFTTEDVNQVIEIGSFMCETHINMDGRCDVNRGINKILDMSPLNFNLMNEAYSQQDNFFNYRILDESFYKDRKFSNQITWTKEKHPGEDIDAWTNITLASTYDLDGSKGPIQSLNTWKDQIYCFQDKGISNILFNSRVQVQASDGIPIEISNNYKVDGYRYITDGIGNINKNAIKVTPSGIYFIDSISNNLYHIGESISDISTTHNMTTWFKGNDIQSLLYDNVNHDIYVVNKDEALCYSEILGQFTSRMSYGGLNVLESYRDNVYSMKYRPTDGIRLYHMFKGEYDTYLEWCSNNSCIVDRQPWSITFISNGIPYNQTDYDKVFENIDYRMDSYSLDDDQWILDNKDSLSSILVENEYQNTGIVNLVNTKDRPSNLKSKFRTWRINIPRNSKLDSRGRGLRDRIRNQWCKITLSKAVSHKKCILHDINVTYYI